MVIAMARIIPAAAPIPLRRLGANDLNTCPIPKQADPLEIAVNAANVPLKLSENDWHCPLGGHGHGLQQVAGRL
jgi:hypothetical protein